MKAGSHSPIPPKMSTLRFLEEIQTLVRDRLQVVSYKWLSRNFSLPANDAKRLLQEYVDKYGDGSRVIYALSGWLKTNPPAYKIQLVSGTNLEDSEVEFEGNCSIHIYSVQASLPKDPATLWNTDFIQSEELYKQPPTVINCLRDNRFGGISNSSVQRTADGTSVSISCHQSEDVFNSNAIPKTISSFSQQSKVPQPIDEISAHTSKLPENAKTATKSAGSHERPTDNDCLSHPVPNKKNGQNEAVNTGKSLSSMWGRAPRKLNTASPIEETTSSLPPADAQTNVYKISEFDGSDDEGGQVNVKRPSQKKRSHKRRVVLDSSDEDENEAAINLSSPDVAQEKSCSDLRKSIKTLHAAESKTENGVEEVEHRPTLQKEKKTGKQDSDSKNASKASLGGMKNQVPENIAKRKANQTNPAPASPKRKRVLKTHIDERGREVTEVVWEGEDEKKKLDETSTIKRTDGSTYQTTINSSIGQNKKSPAVGSSAPPKPLGKAGNKKTGNSKDPKQGHIMSFFKRI